MTDKNFVLEYAGTLVGAVSDSPFKDDWDTVVLRHASSGKLFGIILSVREDKIGRSGKKVINILNLKSRPEDSLILFELYPDIVPAYHMNKTHWITLPLDGCLSDNLVRSLINSSYDITKAKRKA